MRMRPNMRRNGRPSRANHELNMTGIWQRNNYEHIIRGERFREYLELYR